MGGFYTHPVFSHRKQTDRHSPVAWAPVLLKIKKGRIKNGLESAGQQVEEKAGRAVYVL
jgi:hypothetical protein